MNQKEDRLFRASLIALLILYVVGGNIAQLFSNIGYPRFDFDFMHTARNVEVTHYELQFSELNNKSLPEPLYFADANAWIETAQSDAARMLINRIGIAASAGDSARADSLRSELELLYFGEVVSAEYKLVLRIVNTGGSFPFESNIVDQTLEKFRFSRALSSNESFYYLLD